MRAILITQYYMPFVKVKENETIEFAMRRFRRSCDRAGVIPEVRRRLFYDKPAWIRKHKKQVAAKKEYRRQIRSQALFKRKY